MSWDWQWPNPGANPINQSLDTEIFDGDKMPLAETVVREAVQNSLDAHKKGAEPAHIRFGFHESTDASQIEFLKSVMDYRSMAGFEQNQEWLSGIVKWLTVEDFNTSGLLGALNDRAGNFWNYWLNFGLSNKGGNSRGGRGIGRVTFLIASQINTVIGLTRRNTDGLEIGCGMAVLRAGQYADEFRSTHAYLAAEEAGAVYRLHNDSDFTTSLTNAFKLRSDVSQSNDSGLSLVIPYPHEKLTEAGILTSCIEHFAPAILDRKLIVSVGNRELNHATLADLAMECKAEFKSAALRESPDRFVGLLKRNMRGADNGMINLASPVRSEFASIRDSKTILELTEILENEETVSFDVAFQIRQKSAAQNTFIRASMSRTPTHLTSIDMMFRDGMYLPDVTTRSLRGYDLVLAVSDTALSDYLNLCEGKAHLDLLETVEVRQKLKAQGHTVAVKRLIKALPEELRKIFLPDITEPDSTVFSNFFNVPEPETSKPQPKTPSVPDTPNPDVDPPKRRISPFLVSEITGGLKVTANKENQDWPVAMRMTIAYADGTRKPKWSGLDFQLDDLETSSSDCEAYWFKDNIALAQGCGSNFELDIVGFDVNRELDIRVHKARAVESA